MVVSTRVGDKRGKVPKGMGTEESLLEYEDDDDKTAMMDDMAKMMEKMVDDMMEMTERMSDIESDNDDENFVAENAPRPPPLELLYNGQGMSACEGQEARDRRRGMRHWDGMKSQHCWAINERGVQMPSKSGSGSSAML